MLQIRIHGRGGQGVVTAAEMLSLAAFEQGHHAQAFPSFGSERTGAPVVAFCRIDSREIRLREPVLAPDVVIVQDPTLLHQVDVFQGLKPDGYVLINTRKSFDELGLSDMVQRFRHERLTTVPATDIALKLLGRPLPNAVLLGGFAALISRRAAPETDDPLGGRAERSEDLGASLSGMVTLEAVEHAINHKFSGKVAAGNVAGAKEAFAYVQNEMTELSHAQTS
ncbi:2-oxoacid:acceptor oxidoreductase [Rhodoferax lacus]|uniref:2-oxoacid:acceptor oxidoreductase n=1 Tax=Rhodoferax lacus TaxID=2184758 RepID=A0A3E1RDA0_9BURK|nr:2-oxoacid:acceptor oxidoreductase family protein [Rhodoferax lacus]RFO97347.1 2-oxoacid:acceptor oxidoreductase [Rhodoferax lacus]